MKIKIKNLLKETYHNILVDDLYRLTRLFVIDQISELELADEVYELLIQDHSWSEQKTKLSQDEWRLYREYGERYSRFINELEKKSIEKGWKVWKSSWFYIRKDEGKEAPVFQRKIYVTLDKKRGLFENNTNCIFNLIELLDQANISGRKHFKIPTMYMTFVNHLDNLVIYVDQESDTNTIEEILKKSGLIYLDRQLVGRTVYGMDIGRKSDTQIVSEHFVQYLKFNKDKIKNTKKQKKR